MLAVRDQLLNVLSLTADSCETMFDGQPKPSCGELFVSVHPGSWTPSPSGDYDLDERFSVCVTVTMRLGAVPQDRWGPNLLDLINTGLEAVLRQIIGAIHKQESVRNAANTVYGLTPPLAGFCEDIELVDGGRPDPKGPDWFSAEADPADMATVFAHSGVAQTLTFGKARRVQQIFPVIAISPPVLPLTAPVGPVYALPVAPVNVAYSETFTATGGDGSGDYTFTLVAMPLATTATTLPTGLVLNATTGVISGTPTVIGTVTFRMAATDPTGFVGYQTYSVAVAVHLGITTSGTLPADTVGVAYSETFTSTGGTGAVTWSVTAGALPAGLTLNSSTGTLSGTPTLAGAYSFTVTATDSLGATANLNCTLTINAALTITTATPLPGGTHGTPYSDQLTTTGGTGAVTYAVTSGSLPPGLALSGGGLLTGTP